MDRCFGDVCRVENLKQDGQEHFSFYVYNYNAVHVVYTGKL